MSKFKPCPFCGGMPKTEVKQECGTGKIFLCIFCKECERVMQRRCVLTNCSIDRMLDTIDELVELWNRRAET